jgi:hypothetical protein
MVRAIAISILRRLPAHEAEDFDAVVSAVAPAGVDMLRLQWKFLAEELRRLAPQPAEIWVAVDPVIKGLDLLAAGQEWPRAAADTTAIWAASAVTWADSDLARAAHGPYIRAAAAAAEASSRAAASGLAIAVARAAELAAYAHPSVTAATRRQRDLLLQLLAEV